jgi:tripartite-type tricarboxylate transporter receptor subunit TctC
MMARLFAARADGMVRIVTLCIASLGLLLCGLAPAQAADFPSRPIKLIVPFTPGTGMDNIARQVAEKMTARLGQPVVVENRLGTAGNLGAEMVAKAPADGHTLLVTASNLTITATLYPTPGFAPMTDLVPMTIAAWATRLWWSTPRRASTRWRNFLRPPRRSRAR